MKFRELLGISAMNGLFWSLVAGWVSFLAMLRLVHAVALVVAVFLAALMCSMFVLSIGGAASDGDGVE